MWWGGLLLPIGCWSRWRLMSDGGDGGDADDADDVDQKQITNNNCIVC